MSKKISKEPYSNTESLSMDDMGEYAGQWVGIVRGRIAAHHDSMIEVYEETKKRFPDEACFMGRIQENRLAFLIDM